MQVGAVNRDQMLKQMGAAVPSDYPWLELSVKQYVLGVINLPNVTVGRTETDYLTDLWQLGTAITWDKLGLGSSPSRSSRPTGIGAKQRRDDEDNL